MLEMAQPAPQDRAPSLAVARRIQPREDAPERGTRDHDDTARDDRGPERGRGQRGPEVALPRLPAERPQDAPHHRRVAKLAEVDIRPVDGVREPSQPIDVEMPDALGQVDPPELIAQIAQSGQVDVTQEVPECVRIDAWELQLGHEGLLDPMGRCVAWSYRPVASHGATRTAQWKGDGDIEGAATD